MIIIINCEEHLEDVLSVVQVSHYPPTQYSPETTAEQLPGEYSGPEWQTGDCILGTWQMGDNSHTHAL